MSDLLKTPIADIATNRAKLMGLAANLFGRTSPSCVRAFGQFGRNPDLIRVIEAKRTGIFDYGACIVDTSAGVKYPTDTEKVLSAIDKAEKGTITVDDLIPLFSGNRDTALEAFSKVVLKAPAVTASQQPAVVETKPAVQVPVAEQAPKPAEETKVKAVPAKEILTESLNTEKLVLIGQGLVQLRDEVIATQQTHSNLLGLVLRDLNTLNRNLTTIATCFGGVDLEELESADSTPAESQNQGATENGVQLTLVENKPDPAVVEQLPPEVEAPAEVSEDSSDAEVEVTEELLSNLSIEQLVELAGKLGIKLNSKAAKPYPSVLKNKIRVAVGLPVVEKK